MSKSLDSNPRRDGYRMPGEFEPHSGCWLLWPERPDNWRLGAKPAQQAFLKLATAIAGSEPVTVGVSASQYANARRLLPSQVRVVELSSNDAWMRDVGPTFVVNDRGGIRGVDWQFNAWGGLRGGLYFPWDRDDAVAQKVTEIEGCDRYRAPFILEGGSIHVDGQGTVITTEECLLNPNRNPGLSRTQVETQLKRYLNVETVVWLGKGVLHDETDGHVDNLCAYVRPAEVVPTRLPQRELRIEQRVLQPGQRMLVLEPRQAATAQRFVQPACGGHGTPQRRRSRASGTCCVTQWTLPPPSRSSRPGTPTTSRLGNRSCSLRKASRSRRGSSNGATIQRLPM